MTTPVASSLVPMGRELRLRIGTPDTVGHPLLRELTLPLLPDFVDATAYAIDALEQAATSRQGVVLIGPGDCGKSTAITQAIRAFDEAELVLAEASPDYASRHIVHVHGLRAEEPMDVLIALYAAAFGTPPLVHSGKRRKKEDELMVELATRLRDERVAVLVLDDAQDIAPSALRLIERFMAHAVDRETDRLAGDTVAPAGVGIILVGTARLEATVRYGEEAGNAWKVLQHVHPVPAESVPTALRRLLPAWEHGAAQVGDSGWASLVTTHISGGRPVPIGSLDSLARLYVRRLATAAATEGVIWHTVDEVPWDVEMFCHVRSELLIPTGAGVQPPRVAA